MQLSNKQGSYATAIWIVEELWTKASLVEEFSCCTKTKAKEYYMRPYEVVCESKSGLWDLPMMCAQSLWKYTYMGALHP